MTVTPAANAIPVFTIPKIQGRASASPYVDQTVSTSGVVTGVERSDRTGRITGIFLQDATGDRNARTSDGIHVKVAGEMDPALDKQISQWARLTVTGKVDEDGAGTVLRASASALEVAAAAATGSRPVATALQLPTSTRARNSYFTALDGMLVSIDHAIVIDPTSSGELIAVDAKTAGSTRYRGRFDELPAIPIADRAGHMVQANVGTRLHGVVGPLSFQNGAVPHWHINQSEGFSAVDHSGAPPAMWGDIDADGAITPVDLNAITGRAGTAATSQLDPADVDGSGRIDTRDVAAAAARAERVTGAPTFRVASYNLGNLFDTVDDPHHSDTVLRPEEYGSKLSRIAQSIVQQLGAPSVVALQEVENDRVLKDLTSRPELAALGYKFKRMTGEDPRGIDVALLYRSADVKVSGVRQFQPANPDRKYSPRAGLYSRPPLVADLTITGAGGAVEDLTIAVAHLKSHFSPNGNPTEEQRIREARGLNDLAVSLKKADPTRNVMIVGDMNDGVGSTAINKLLGPRLRHSLADVTAELIPQGEQYSFRFRGASNLLDHITASKDLASRAEFAGVVHINSDVAEASTWNSLPYGASDHDPVYADFRFGAVPVADAVAGAAAAG